VAVVVIGLLGVPATSRAQASADGLQQEIQQLKQDLDALKRDYEARLAALEAKLAAVPGAPAAPATAPAPANTAPADQGATLPVYGAATAGSKIFNPDIAVIGDFLGTAGRNTVAPSPALSMHETEASFQAVVDPYARADFFLSFGEERRRSRGRVLDPDVASRRAAHARGQDARGVRQGQRSSQPCAAVGRQTSGDRESRRR
jgi:uncharacterized protein